VGGLWPVDGWPSQRATRKQAFRGWVAAAEVRNAFEQTCGRPGAELAEVLQEGAPMGFAFALGGPVQELLAAGGNALNRCGRG